jgi:hypothetical protein
MTALAPQYMSILKKILAERFVPFLPELLDTIKPPAEQQTKQLSRAFSAFTLNKILNIVPQIAAASVVDDFNDKGIDAIYYESESEILYVLQAKLKESEQFKQEDALTFCEGVRLLLKQDFTDFNVHFKNRRVEIESALDSCSHIQLVVPYTGDGVSQTANAVFQSLFNDDNVNEERLEKQVNYYSADDIKRDLLVEQSYQKVNTEIALQKCVSIQEPRTTYYGIANLSDLVSLHVNSGKALYERNIRYFLGSGKSDVNKAIQRTLQDSPENFFYLNNGVTAVCDLIEPKGIKNGAKRLKVRGLSIINGAQTVASVAEFVRGNPTKNIDDAKVMFTLIKAPADGEFGKHITKARNHQNPVQVANFASLDENQERLRQEIAHLGFEYHYRPEAYILGNKAITLEEALRALALNNNDPRYLVWLKSELTRLSNPESSEYGMLFPVTLQGVALVNCVNCYRTLRALVVEYDERARGQEKLIYRHGIYAIITVMMKRLRIRIGAATLINQSEIHALISHPLDELRQQTFDLSQSRLFTQGPLAYFRNQGNVISFIGELMVTHFALTNDPAIVPLRNTQNDEDAYTRKRLIDYLSSRAPQL